MSIEVNVISSERARNRIVVGLVGILGLVCAASALLSDPAGLYKAWGITLNDMNEGVFDSVLSDEYVGKIVSDSQGYPDESVRIDERNANNNNSVVIYNSDGSRCVRMNTDDWGFPEHYVESEPEVRTAYEAIDNLVVDAQTGEVYVVQGDQIKPFNSADVFANMTEFCVAK